MPNISNVRVVLRSSKLWKMLLNRWKRHGFVDTGGLISCLLRLRQMPLTYIYLHILIPGFRLERILSLCAYVNGNSPTVMTSSWRTEISTQFEQRRVMSCAHIYQHGVSKVDHFFDFFDKTQTKTTKHRFENGFIYMNTCLKWQKQIIECIPGCSKVWKMQQPQKGVWDQK